MRNGVVIDSHGSAAPEADGTRDFREGFSSGHYSHSARAINGAGRLNGRHACSESVTEGNARHAVFAANSPARGLVSASGPARNPGGSRGSLGSSPGLPPIFRNRVLGIKT